MMSVSDEKLCVGCRKRPAEDVADQCFYCYSAGQRAARERDPAAVFEANVQATLTVMERVIDRHHSPEKAISISRISIHAVRFCGTTSEDVVRPVVNEVLNRLCVR